MKYQIGDIVEIYQREVEIVGLKYGLYTIRWIDENRVSSLVWEDREIDKLVFASALRNTTLYKALNEDEE